MIALPGLAWWLGLRFAGAFFIWLGAGLLPAGGSGLLPAGLWALGSGLWVLGLCWPASRVALDRTTIYRACCERSELVLSEGLKRRSISYRDDEAARTVCVFCLPLYYALCAAL